MHTERGRTRKRERERARERDGETERAQQMNLGGFKHDKDTFPTHLAPSHLPYPHPPFILALLLCAPLRWLDCRSWDRTRQLADMWLPTAPDSSDAQNMHAFLHTARSPTCRACILNNANMKNRRSHKRFNHGGPPDCFLPNRPAGLQPEREAGEASNGLLAVSP